MRTLLGMLLSALVGGIVCGLYRGRHQTDKLPWRGVRCRVCGTAFQSAAEADLGDDIMLESAKGRPWTS